MWLRWTQQKWLDRALMVKWEKWKLKNVVWDWLCGPFTSPEISIQHPFCIWCYSTLKPTTKVAGIWWIWLPHISILSTDLKYQNCISLNFELPYCFIQIILINLVARQIPARYPSQIYSLEWNWDTDHKIVLTNAQWCHVNQQFVLQEEYRIVSLTTQTYNITTAHAPTCTPHWHTHSSALHTATHPCLPAPQTHVTHTPMCTHNHRQPPAPMRRTYTDHLMQLFQKASLIISPFWNLVGNSLWNIIFETKFL
jgi:hypothetical protein